jgi:hypothetical protein
MPSRFSATSCAPRRILANAPRHEIYGRFDGLPVRRLLLERTRCHLYYLVLEDEDLVRIVAVWGAMRGRDPGFIEAPREQR